MEYANAKREVLIKRVVGTVVLVISVVFVLAGLLLFLYGSLDGGGSALASLSLALKRVVYGVFERTQFLLPIWNNASIPNPNELVSMRTIGFLVWYFGAFLGASLIGSGNRLARRLRAIDRKIEDEAIRESLSGERRRSRVELERQVNIPKQSVWSQFHTLYIAPLIVGIVLWLIAKALT